MKIGILGTGFGMQHAKIFKNISGRDSIKIYGRNEKKLNIIQKKMNIDVTNDALSIISDKSIRLIDVCLPSSMHRKYVIDALKNGKNVFCETPVALNMEDALAMQEASNWYGQKVFVDNFIKFESAYKYLYKIIKNNTLGKLKVLHIKRKTPPLWGSLGLDKIVTNLMIHEFDFVTWILDKPKNIMAFGIEPRVGLSHVEAVLNYGDTIVNIQASSIMPAYHPFTVGYEADFENGVIEFVENGYEARTENSLKLFTKDTEETVELKKENCYELAFKHMLECCEKDIPSILSLEDAIKSLNIALHVKKIVLSDNHSMRIE